MMVSVVTFAVVLLSSLVVSESANCLEIQTACSLDSGCRLLQTNYLQDCQSTLTQSGVACSQACKDSYHALLANAKGATFYQCDCGSGALSSTCKTYTDNLLGNCFGGVAPTPPPVVTDSVSLAVGSCSSVTFSCTFNPTCQQLYLAYNSSCANAFHGVGCSPQCNQSYYDLLRNSVGSKFLVCSCGNDTTCNVSSANLYRTCYNGSTPEAPPLIATPTQNPPGTYPRGSCEDLHEICIQHFGVQCGNLQRQVLEGNCSYLSTAQGTVNMSLSCSNDCQLGLQQLAASLSGHTALTCTCANSSSTVCQNVMNHRAVFTHCGVTAAPSVVTSVPITTSSPTTGQTGRGVGVVGNMMLLMISFAIGHTLMML